MERERGGSEGRERERLKTALFLHNEKHDESTTVSIPVGNFVIIAMKPCHSDRI